MPMSTLFSYVLVYDKATCCYGCSIIRNESQAQSDCSICMRAIVAQTRSSRSASCDEEVIFSREGSILLKLWLSSPGTEARTASFTDYEMKG